MADLNLIMFVLSLATLIFTILIYYDLRRLLLHFGLLKIHSHHKNKEHDHNNNVEEELSLEKNKKKQRDLKHEKKEKAKTIFDDD